MPHITSAQHQWLWLCRSHKCCPFGVGVWPVKLVYTIWEYSSLMLEVVIEISFSDHMTSIQLYLHTWCYADAQHFRGRHGREAAGSRQLLSQTFLPILLDPLLLFCHVYLLEVVAVSVSSIIQHDHYRLTQSNCHAPSFHLYYSSIQHLYFVIA